MREFESDLRPALALDPSNADAQAGLMLFLSLEGRFAEASEHFGLVRLSRLGHDVPWTKA
jgi:hypothetical protein